MTTAFDEHPAEQWIPVRWVKKAVRCDFCRSNIPAGKPGTTTGSRGTKAWYCRHRNIFECLGCRSEAMRADTARKEGR